MKVLTVILCLLCGPVYATPIAFTTAIITKQYPSPDGDDLLAINRDQAEWCTGTIHGLAISSFQVGGQVDSMANGVYSCTGEFVGQPEQAQFQVYSLGTCQVMDPVAMKSACPPQP